MQINITQLELSYIIDALEIRETEYVSSLRKKLTKQFEENIKE